jgi:hypothetical protein
MTFSRPISTKPGGDGLELDLFNEAGLVARGGALGQLGKRPDVLVALQGAGGEVEVLDSDGLVAAARFQVGVEALGPLELVQDEGVRAEVGDVVSDVDVHAVDHGHYDDEGGGGDDHAEEGQERPQLVAAHRFESDLEGLARGAP